MLSPKVQELLQEVFGHFGEDDRQLAQDDPERCLVKLLEKIKEDLPVVSVTLEHTVGDTVGEIIWENDEEEDRQEQARQTARTAEA